MTRKELSQVYYLKREKDMWEKRLRDLRESSLIKSPASDGMPFADTGEPSDATFNRISKIIEMQSYIEAYQANIDYQIEKVEKYIMTLDDSFLRQIIEYRCCRMMSWPRVAMMIGAGTSSESCRKYYERKIPWK